MTDFYSQSSQIRALKFQALPEDFHFDGKTFESEDEGSKKQSKSPNFNHNNEQDEEDGILKRLKLIDCILNEKLRKKTTTTMLKSNFTLESNYPAVIFDNVCFSVDRSQQQSNFLNELLCKLKYCLSCPKALEEQQESRKVEILKSINLNVPYGSIFGLLGPSSCGKTTLLRCLVGLLEQDSVSMSLFGHTIKSGKDLKKKGDAVGHRRKCKIPGSNVGYMPQDLGLYEDFTISQLLTMFGQYMGMNIKLIGERIKFMANFLDLPDINREIITLSGGQKRRVSFAVACLHMPALIILDEPTVGVDPLLRQSIWKYLRRLADEENKTIIITTHYIEEAAQADQVALMRAGEILIQDKPANIMSSNNCKTLEEAFLKICNSATKQPPAIKYKLYPQNKFNWHDKLQQINAIDYHGMPNKEVFKNHDLTVQQLNLRAQQEKLNLFDQIYSEKEAAIAASDKLSMSPTTNPQHFELLSTKIPTSTIRKANNKLDKQNYRTTNIDHHDHDRDQFNSSGEGILKKMRKFLAFSFALLYKNYRRNVNSMPLLAFQFLLPIIQMISFSLCVGGKPANIGLGLVNFDQPLYINSNGDQIFTNSSEFNSTTTTTTTVTTNDFETLLLSDNYLNFLDTDMLTLKKYDTLNDALGDVRRAKLWAVMEIGENFTETVLKRFDLDNFYQLKPETIKQSIIKLYPDRSNKVLDMICHRSLMTSYRSFLLNQFDHFKQLPIEIKEPIFDIKPNLISNSIDGYTESIAAGLLASLTYIMAAGLTTFIMVVERSNGILERTYTSGVNPVAYLLAHAAFRSLVMMLQIALVLILTFYILKQPMVGSIWLAYLMLMTLNLTGISYGLLISSLVTDQNGAALTIVSSLVVKITMSGILWPFEAIPQWLRLICYCQPLTMPVQALKTITLKGGNLQDKAVYLGFSVSIGYLIVFLTIAARRFKFYQH